MLSYWRQRHGRKIFWINHVIIDSSRWSFEMRKILSFVVSSFVIVLLTAGLLNVFFGDSSNYKISPELKTPESGGGLMQNTADAEQILLKPDDASLVVEGKNLYNSYCASCHGFDLKGQKNWKQKNKDGLMPAPPHDKSGHTWHHPNSVLFMITKFGSSSVTGQESDMPGFGKLISDKQIISILSFIKNSWPPDIRKRHDKINLQSKIN